MCGNALLLALAFQVGPFYEQRSDFAALRPFWSREAETTDVLWPVFTAHRDWWRFCWFTHYQEQQGGGYQFEVMPLWFNGRSTGPDRSDSSYWGLFPLWGSHPHFLLMYDWKFCLWPLWMQYRMPRPQESRWMTTNAVLFPFIHWRDDGSWGFWPLYGVNHQRESDHRTVLWPIFTWAGYREDRDTSGAGASWMLWPLAGRVSRTRETQTLILPPLFSWTELRSRSQLREDLDGPEFRLRCPWPFFEYERRNTRTRLSVWPFYEDVADIPFSKGRRGSRVRRFGWRLVELYDEETRVFPFWASGRDYLRIWPFWESRTSSDGVVRSRFLSPFPIRWADSVDRNWAKFWTFYERETDSSGTAHSLLWGIVRWRTTADD